MADYRCLLPIQLKDFKLVALLDTGNTWKSAISKELATKLGVVMDRLIPPEPGFRLATADQTADLKVLGQLPGPLIFRAGEGRYRVRPVVIEGLNGHMNLSGPWMAHQDWTLRPKRGQAFDASGKLLPLRSFQGQEAINSFTPLRPSVRLRHEARVAEEVVVPRAQLRS